MQHHKQILWQILWIWSYLRMILFKGRGFMEKQSWMNVNRRGGWLWVTRSFSVNCNVWGTPASAKIICQSSPIASRGGSHTHATIAACELILEFLPAPLRDSPEQLVRVDKRLCQWEKGQGGFECSDIGHNTGLLRFLRLNFHLWCLFRFCIRVTRTALAGG